jgi:cAMP-dependent protein kinase regulator
MLSELTDYERSNLADALESTSFENNECIIQQGDSADCMYFVEDGYIRIVLGKGAESKEISVLKKGDYFGEMALVMNQPRSASVYAKGKAKCAKLDVGAFERLLGPCMEIMKRNIENYDSTRKAFGLE